MAKHQRRKPRGLHVAVAQISPVLGDVEANLQLHRDAVDRAEADGVELLVFPELSLTGYRLRDTVPDVASLRDGEVFAELGQLSKKVAIAVGLVEETAGHFFHNGAAVFDAGRLVGVHHKTYLPTYGMFDEQRYFARGRSIRSFEVRGHRVGVLVCEDMLHPTAPMIAALDGASTILVLAASPARGVTATVAADDEAVEHTTPVQLSSGQDSGDDEGAQPVHPTASIDPVPGDGRDANARHWENYNRVIARTFGVHVVFANRSGVEDGTTFWGGSEVLSAAGDTLAKAAYFEDADLRAIISDETVRRARLRNPTLRDEDMDLAINELCRLRGRAAPAQPRGSGAASADGSEDRNERRPGGSDRGGDDRRDRGDSGGPGGADRKGGFEKRGGFGRDRDDRGGFGNKGGFEKRGGFGRDRDDRGGFGNKGGFDKRGGFEKRGGFGRDRDDRGGFGNRGGFDKKGGSEKRGGFGRDRDDRGGFGNRGGFDKKGGFEKRGGFGRDRNDRDDRGGFGSRGFEKKGGFEKRGGFGNKGGFDKKGGSEKRGGFGRDRNDRDDRGGFDKKSGFEKRGFEKRGFEKRGFEKRGGFGRDSNERDDHGGDERRQRERPARGPRGNTIPVPGETGWAERGDGFGAPKRKKPKFDSPGGGESAKPKGKTGDVPAAAPRPEASPAKSAAPVKAAPAKPASAKPAAAKPAPAKAAAKAAPAKKAVTKKVATRKVAAKKVATKKVAKKQTTKKVAARKVATKKVAAKKVATKKVAAKKVAKKKATKKVAAKKVATKKVTAKKVAKKKATKKK